MREYCTQVPTLDATPHHLVSALPLLPQAMGLTAAFHSAIAVHLLGYYRLGMEPLRQMA